MLPETRQLLEDFYAPYNRRLAALLASSAARAALLLEEGMVEAAAPPAPPGPARATWKLSHSRPRAMFWYCSETLALAPTAPAGGVQVSGGSNISGGLANTPSSETAQNAVDGLTSSKYLNFDGPGSGLVFTAPQPVVADALRLISRTNDDNWQWDPKRWQVWA
jgi:hypothetical protein